MSRRLPHVLNILLAEGRFTADDLAEMANCSASMIYRVRNEDSDLSFEKAQSLSQALCRVGEVRVALCMVTPTLRIVTEADARVTGCMDDDAADLAIGLGAAVALFRDGDPAAALRALDEVERALRNARAECAQL